MSKEPRKFLSICENCGANEYMLPNQIVCDKCKRKTELGCADIAKLMRDRQYQIYGRGGIRTL